MNSEIERVLEKVQKLMRLAEDKGASETEIETALRQAQKLLLKHNLTMELAREYNGDKGKAEDILKETLVFKNRPWVRMTMSAIARLYFCKYLVSMGDMRAKTRHYFVGRESNSKTASLMAAFVVSSILATARKNRRIRGEKSAYESAFCLAAARRIAMRVRDMIENNQELSTGTGLMVIDTTKKENDEFSMQEFGITLPVKSHARPPSNIEGYRKGDEYGKTIGLNNQVENKKTETLKIK